MFSDLHGLIVALNLDRPVLLGHSLGGFIALAYALTRRPQALIVVDMRARLTDSRFMRLVRVLPAPSYRDEAELLRRFRLLPADSRPPARAVPGDCQAQRPSCAGRAAQAEEPPGGPPPDTRRSRSALTRTRLSVPVCPRSEQHHAVGPWPG